MIGLGTATGNDMTGRPSPNRPRFGAQGSSDGMTAGPYSNMPRRPPSGEGFTPPTGLADYGQPPVLKQGDGMTAYARPPIMNRGGQNGVNLTPFGPGNDLQGTAILPGQSATTANAAGWANDAAGAVAGSNPAAWQSIDPFTSSSTAAYGAIGPVGTHQSGTTDPSGAYGYQDAAVRAMQGGSSAAGKSGLIGLSGYGGAGVDDGGFHYAGPGGDVTAARALTSKSLEQAMTGPERQQLAQEQYDQMVERSNPQFTADQRALAGKTAALGRAGSGMVNSEFADLGTARERELSLARRELSTQAAGQTLQDRLDRTNLGLGVASGFAEIDKGTGALQEQGAQRRATASAANANSMNDAAGIRLNANNGLVNAGQFDASMLRGLGTDRFGMDSTITGERGADADRRFATDTYNTGLGERKASFGYNADKDTYGSRVAERNSAQDDSYRRGQYGMDKLGSLNGYLGGRENQDRSNRGEYRDERGYQTAQGQQAVDDQYRSAQFDEWLRGQRAGRAQGYANTGYGGQPTSAYQSASNYYGDQAAGSYGAIGPMAQYMAQYGKKPGQPSGGGTQYAGNAVYA